MMMNKQQMQQQQNVWSTNAQVNSGRFRDGSWVSQDTTIDGRDSESSSDGCNSGNFAKYFPEVLSELNCPWPASTSLKQQRLSEAMKFPMPQAPNRTQRYIEAVAQQTADQSRQGTRPRRVVNRRVSPTPDEREALVAAKARIAELEGKMKATEEAEAASEADRCRMASSMPHRDIETCIVTEKATTRPRRLVNRGLAPVDKRVDEPTISGFEARYDTVRSFPIDQDVSRPTAPEDVPLPKWCDIKSRAVTRQAGFAPPPGLELFCDQPIVISL